ncbi:hypothetical protein [Aureispira anguillae]|uniref:Helix-turn-helix domain-containing protein n=1 Tax=Aureispira anguillae TaxID=2864201 RepID=A0A916DTI0_9BACT|nr:hypothetical protein [Aureispira anguillae]BDS11501.1 hypothetical protein AsAng_0022150 [Aureispira anguillae]
MPKKNTNSKPKQEKGILLILILLVIFASASFWEALKLSPRIKTKQDLADYYGITRKTLNKWITHFTTINLEEFKKIRKITFSDLSQILNQLGRVKENSQPLSKKEIKKRCETSDRVLRENISEKYCGISLETYKQVNIFPPNISKKILSHIGV